MSNYYDDRLLLSAARPPYHAVDLSPLAASPEDRRSVPNAEDTELVNIF